MHHANISGEIVRNRYQIIDVLGKGGVGITYGAIDLQTQERVAIKAVSLKQLDDWKQIELLEREAKVLAQLNHSAIPKYLDYFQVDSDRNRFFYIVQQLAPGKSLFQLVESGWRTTEAEVKKIAKQILDIFIYLHSLQPPVIHRDIKPHNLIRSEEGKIYLVDFGAVQNTYYNTLMRGSTVVGTFGYMAPEQFQGKATPATDLYGLGATILYLLTHRSPAELPHDTLKIDFRSSVNISEGFANWLEKMLQPDLEDRFASAKEALEGLSDRSLFTNTFKNKWKVPLSLSLIGAIGIGGIVGFNSYKWAILSRLGYLPLGICNDSNLMKNYLETGGDPNVNFPKYWSRFEPRIFLLDCIIDRDISQKTIKENIELLIAKGVDLNNSNHHYLSLAVANNSKDLVEFLIVKGADLNTKDNSGKTPLFYANQQGMVKLLISKGADIHAKDNYGNTPLFEAVSQRDREIIELLITKGANVNARDNDGNTPLKLFKNHKYYSREIQQEVINILIKHGATE
jgi:serine/threonine protein kinase